MKDLDFILFNVNSAFLKYEAFKNGKKNVVGIYSSKCDN